jgi:predicted secreted protein
MVIFLILIGFIGTAFAQYAENMESNEQIPTEKNIGTIQIIDTKFEIKSQQHIEIPTENLTITFLEVTEDSRCPSDVTCVWAGKAALRLDVAKDQNKEITLSTDNSTVNVLDQYQIQLIDLKPYPISTTHINSEEYVVTISVTKNKVAQDIVPGVTLAPLKQLKTGVSTDKIQCRNNLELIFKNNNSPACVKLESIPKLIKRGWLTVETKNSQDQLESTTVTSADNDKLINIKKGESFVVKLDNNYNWRINIDNQTVIDSDYSDIRYSGSQGVYKANNSGQATITGIGDPLCRASEPPCMSPSIVFQSHIKVK